MVKWITPGNSNAIVISPREVVKKRRCVDLRVRVKVGDGYEGQKGQGS